MHSNAYTYRFIIILTGVAALLLSLASTGLKGRQDFNREIDTKKNVLKAVGAYHAGMTPAEVEDTYNQNILERFVGDAGSLSETPGDRPIFIYGNVQNPKGFIVPVSGKGLWSTINGFLALEPDRSTVKGITFYEHGETPGLGGEIEKDWFTGQYVGKKIFSDEGALVSIMIAKGKAPAGSLHDVDGISGSTLTCNGVNAFLKKDLSHYETFLRRH